MSAELLPCPFCGGNEIRLYYVPNTGGNIEFHACSKCAAQGPWQRKKYNGNYVVRGLPPEWNTRASLATDAAEIERLKEALSKAEAEVCYYADKWRNSGISND